MIGVTLGIALMFAVLALSRRQGAAAVGVVIMSMLLWPEYLRVPVGLLQMSAPRMVGLLLLLKFISTGRHRQINSGKVDKLVCGVWLWTILATVLTGAELSQTSQMIGRGFDTVLMYFIARMALKTPEEAKSLYWGLAVTAVAMGGVGIYEAVTYHSPYATLGRGSLGVLNVFGADKTAELRLGLLRARASTNVSIYFGMAMMMVTGFIWSIRGYVESRLIHMMVLTAAFLGALSSMSSGPWAACFILIGLNFYIKRPGLIKPSLYLIVLMAIVLEIASNRHFYNLIDYFSLDKTNAWYRTRLLEVAVSSWRDFWLFGVGSNWPHHWADKVDGRGHIDVVNNFLIISLYGGLPALYMYLSAHLNAIKQTARAWQNDADVSRRKLVFGLAATLIALDVSSMSVGLYGPVLLLSYILLGLMVSASTVDAVERVRPDREAGGARMNRPMELERYIARGHYHE